MSGDKLKDSIDVGLASHDILYRYLDIANEWHRRVIDRTELSFPSPAHFCDPFDCAIPIRLDLLDKQARNRTAKASIKTGYPNERRETRRRRQVQFARKMRHSSRTEAVAREQRLTKWIAENTGVLCFTGCPLNLLFWSLYAAKHTGVCVGFNRSAVEDWCKQLKRKKIECALIPVNYSNAMPIIRDVSTIEETKVAAATIVRTKAPVWQYETESRLVYFFGANRTLPFPPSLVSELYLGCRMDKPAIAPLVDTITRKLPTARIIELETHREKFELIQRNAEVFKENNSGTI